MFLASLFGLMFWDGFRNPKSTDIFRIWTSWNMPRGRHRHIGRSIVDDLSRWPALPMVGHPMDASTATRDVEESLATAVSLTSSQFFVEDLKFETPSPGKSWCDLSPRRVEWVDGLKISDFGFWLGNECFVDAEVR